MVALHASRIIRLNAIILSKCRGSFRTPRPAPTELVFKIDSTNNRTQVLIIII